MWKAFWNLCQARWSLYIVFKCQTISKLFTLYTKTAISALKFQVSYVMTSTVSTKINTLPQWICGFQWFKSDAFTDWMGWDPNCTSLASNRNAYQGTANSYFIGYSIVIPTAPARPSLVFDYLSFVWLNLDQDQSSASPIQPWIIFYLAELKFLEAFPG